VLVTPLGADERPPIGLDLLDHVGRRHDNQYDNL
jgi:hypothetical protein